MKTLDDVIANLPKEQQAIVKARLLTLRAHLAEGEAQAARGEFVEGFSMEALLSELDQAGA